MSQKKSSLHGIIDPESFRLTTVILDVSKSTYDANKIKKKGTIPTLKKPICP
jgi:hypothetical protein